VEGLGLIGKKLELGLDVVLSAYGNLLYMLDQPSLPSIDTVLIVFFDPAFPEAMLNKGEAFAARSSLN
jgi:hypothetical protein